MNYRILLLMTCVAVVFSYAVPAAAQNELYLEITQPGLRRVAIAAPPLMVLPGTPVDASKTFQGTLDNDLAAAAPIAVPTNAPVTTLFVPASLTPTPRERSA